MLRSDETENYNNFFGSREADILVVGCDPTAPINEGKERRPISSPFDLRRDDVSGMVHYRNRYFWQIFTNLCAIWNIEAKNMIEAKDTDFNTQQIFNEHVCVTNAVGEVVSRQDGSYLSTTDSLPLEEIADSPWWKCFTKDRRGGSWKDQLCKAAAGKKKVYITSERLVKPLLIDHGEAKSIRDEVQNIWCGIRKKREKDPEYSVSEYTDYHIKKEKTILGADIYFLYRHHSYRIDR